MIKKRKFINIYEGATDKMVYYDNTIEPWFQQLDFLSQKYEKQGFKVVLVDMSNKSFNAVNVALYKGEIPQHMQNFFGKLVKYKDEWIEESLIID